MGRSTVTFGTDGQLVRSFIDIVWNAGQIDCVSDFIHPDYRVDGSTVGPAWVAENVAVYREAFPDLNVTVEWLVGDQDGLAALLRLQGTHRGTWKGIPASGRRVGYREAAFWTLKDGRIVAGQFVAESLTLRVRLGQIPAIVWNGSVLQ